MIATAVQYADIRGRSKQWVSDQIAAGMPAMGAGRAGSDYRIDTAIALQWEIDKASEKGEARNLTERLMTAQAVKVELENARRKGELMPVADALSVITELATDTAARLDAVAGRLANEIPGITDAATARTRLLEEHRGVRSGIAERFRTLIEQANTARGDSAANHTAAAADGEPVGRRKPNTTPRKRRARTVRQRAHAVHSGHQRGGKKVSASTRDHGIADGKNRSVPQRHRPKTR